MRQPGIKDFKKHTARVRSELSKAGVTKYGLLKLEAKHIPELIHEGEHIEAVAYGLSKNYSAMLVATNLRVIYLDRKPFFTISDELTYEMIAGVGYNIQGRFAAVTLHTRIGDYPLRFVNLEAAEKFIHYIEKRRIEALGGNAQIAKPTNYLADNAHDESVAQLLEGAQPLTNEGKEFLHSHRVGTLSSIDRTGNVHGAVVYYFVDANDNIYVLTKSGTHKAHNILANHQVAMTIYSTKNLQTLQIQGMTEIEPDAGVRDFIYQQLSKSSANKGGGIPPVAKLSEGSFMVIRIRPTQTTYNDFGNN